jgi:hypothetical protein
METQVGSATSTRGGRLGNGGVIIVAVVALLAALIAGQLLTHRASIGRDLTATERATSLSSQEFIVQQGYLEASTSAAGTVPYYRTIGGMTYSDRLFGQGQAASTASMGDRVVEENTITLPGEGAASSAANVMMSEQQRVLEDSTTSASTVPFYRTIDGMTYYDRLTGR